jgi:hypothetical protein
MGAGAARGRRGTARVTVNGLALSRAVQLYGVAGRQRTAVASLVMKLLRAANWSRHVG